MYLVVINHVFQVTLNFSFTNKCIFSHLHSVCESQSRWLCFAFLFECSQNTHIHKHKPQIAGGWALKNPLLFKLKDRVTQNVSFRKLGISTRVSSHIEKHKYSRVVELMVIRTTLTSKQRSTTKKDFITFFLLLFLLLFPVLPALIILCYPGPHPLFVT